MDVPGVARARWRMRGAWLWPSFLVLMVIDALVGHALPPAGEAQSVPGAWLVGLWSMLIGIVVLAPGLGSLIRRRRTDMPRVVARNYGGTFAVFMISAGLLSAGLIHHTSVTAARRALRVADARARAWIEHNAPVAFRHSLKTIDTYEIEPGSVYRACVLDLSGRSYCVVVNTRQAAGLSVRFAGYEPNSVLSEGTG